MRYFLALILTVLAVGTSYGQSKLSDTKKDQIGPATATASGLVSTTAQTFAGVKTIQTGLTVPVTTSGAASSSQVTAGWWVPTGTNGTNVTATTPNSSTFSRIGNVVTFAVSSAATTTAAASSSFRLSLPVTSNFTNVNDAVGTCKGNRTGAEVGYIIGDTTNEELVINYVDSGTGSQTLRCTGQYRVQ